MSETSDSRKKEIVDARNSGFATGAVVVLILGAMFFFWSQRTWKEEIDAARSKASEEAHDRFEDLTVVQIVPAGEGRAFAYSVTDSGTGVWYLEGKKAYRVRLSPTPTALPD